MWGRGPALYKHNIKKKKNCRAARQVCKNFFNDTISQEEHKTIFRGLKISEMTLSNQSHFLQFFGPRKMTYQSLDNSGLRQSGIACPGR